MFSAGTPATLLRAPGFRTGGANVRGPGSGAPSRPAERGSSASTSSAALSSRRPLNAACRSWRSVVQARNLRDELRLNPLGQIASDVAGRPAAGERRFVDLERVKLLPELPRGRCRVPGAGSPDMGQLSVPILAKNEGADRAG